MNPPKRTPRVKRPMQTIGYADRVDFPDLSLTDIEAKVDTGAYTSALHCTDVKLVPGGGERYRLRFTILSGEGRKKRQYLVDSFQYKTIKNSFGQSEKRFVIKTRILIMGRLIRAEFSLANRGSMRFPVLLGRKLLRNKFVVDVSRQNVSFLMKQQAAGN
ncbi:ATP-dependent zinc protease family protein [Larkinella soli]|uniref:ATP-dependent zinc protease family protein n=1 Tax=Larkinella soli TaxID=1770527 RepID=UPI000FFB1898|nr:RimK/LysX family protein [Larkinella soli]